ncbi:MAG TPA: hypothetical protein VFU35_08070, partial [Jatrophihabitans sp.]|nr:hypothetical protein [Jatrophihabitans sp.]
MIDVLGWWRPLLYDPKPVRRRVWWLPGIFLIAIAAGINYSGLADRVTSRLRARPTPAHRADRAA